MKLSKNINILFFGLTLILSLVTFSGVTNYSPIEATKIELIVSNNIKDKRFSIQYKDVSKSTLASISKYSNHSFTGLQNVFNLKENTAFKIYTYKTLSVRAKQLQTKLYCLFTHQTFYNSIV